MNIDLNINNYNVGELKNFFKLTSNYSNAELDKRVTEIETVVSSTAESAYKYQTLDFIRKAKQRLIIEEDELIYNPYNSNSQVKNSINRDQNITKIPLANPPPDPKSNVGQILTPLSNQQPMETTYIESDKALKYDTFISNYVFNTRYRDDFFNTTTNNCTFTLPTIIKNATSITLSSIQYPNAIFTFSNENHTTQIFIHEDTTNNEGTVIIPEGNYDITTFPSMLQNEINNQIIGIAVPPRFTVTISPSTHFTTISNSTYTFSMDLVTSYAKNLGENCGTDNYNFTFKNGSNDAKKNKIQPSDLYCSLGYMIGYRKTSYSSSMSYISESLFDSERYNYIYFALNDYVGNQNINNIGIFPQSVLDQNILALVPINSAPFTTTFSDGSTYIYRTRNYNGPVNLKKISIQLINPMGSLADIHLCEYTFCLQIQTIANMTVKNKYKMSSNF